MEWPMVTFGDVAEVVTGNTPPRNDLENYGIGVPWVKPPDLDAWEPITKTSESLSAKVTVHALDLAGAVENMVGFRG